MIDPFARDFRHVVHDGLRLDAPTEADVEGLHAIYSDPRVWTHFPSLRHADVATTVSMMAVWSESWRGPGLGPWVVREADDDTILGNCGCTLRDGVFWNLGYRFSPESQGRGLATRIAQRAVAAAREVRPEVPVVAYLLDTNPSSRRVAEKIGLTLRHQGPDAGNPEPDAVRLVFADRPLSAQVLAAVMA